MSDSLRTYMYLYIYVHVCYCVYVFVCRSLYVLIHIFFLVNACIFKEFYLLSIPLNKTENIIVFKTYTVVVYQFMLPSLFVTLKRRPS